MTGMRRANVGGRIVALVALGLVVLGGCSTESELQTPATGVPCTDDEFSSLALAVSGRAMSDGPRMAEPVRGIVRLAVERGVPLSIINADGEPREVARVRPLGLASGSAGYERGVARELEAIEAAMASVRADSPQMDVIATLQVAVRTGKELSGDGRTLVLMVDSLLSTVAPVDFTVEGMLAAEPADVVAHVEAHGGLPDLSDVMVLLSGVGNTAEPQDSLPPAARSNLAAIWTAISEAGGATCVAELDSSPRGWVVENVPAVSLVPIPQALESVPIQTQPIILRADRLRFDPDSAMLSDTNEAGRIVEDVAAQLVADPPECLAVVGTTATGTPGRGVDPMILSARRARVVADLLIAAGVPPGSLRVSGIGADPFVGRAVDIDPAGAPIPAAAALNRSVRISTC